MQKFPAFLATALVVASPSFAADMAARAPLYKAPPPAPEFGWTGYYVGGNLGWARENASGTSDYVDTSIFATAPSNPQGNSLSNTSFMAGLQAGYNWQVAPRFVVGAEGNFDWLNTKYSFCRQTEPGSIACLDAPPNLDGFESIAGRTNWLASLRPRAGVTFDRILFYGTGGVAWGDIKTTESLSCLAGGCGGSGLMLAASSSVSQVKTGWVAGLGAEGFVTANWSIKGEWLHYDLGTLSNTFTTVGVPGTQSVVWSRSERYDTFLVGLNWHLNPQFGMW